MSRAIGVTDQDLAAIPDHRVSDRFSVAEVLVLDLAEAMTSTPADIPSILRDELLQHFTKGELMELVSTIAWENHRGRVNRALGVRASGFSDGAYCALPAHRTPPR